MNVEQVAKYEEDTVVTESTDLRETLRALPKVELHRHLEGSVRLETLLELASQYKISLPAKDRDGLRPHVQITPDSPMTATHFLSKFELLRQFYQAPEVIQRVAREAVEDAADDNVKYMEMRFTPKALSKLRNFSYDEVIRWVCDSSQEAAKRCGITVRLIVSMNRHESVRDGERAIRAALDHRAYGVVGIDLAGREAGVNFEAFHKMFVEAKTDGLGITVHAGEWAGPANIRDAITKMGAQRIGHGVRVVEDHRVVQLALTAKPTFEVCPTSNVQSGSVASYEQHPLRDMLQLGLKVTLNTDDPSVSGVTLSDELMIAAEKLHLTLEQIKRCIMNGAENSFLPEPERTALVEQFKDSPDNKLSG